MLQPSARSRRSLVASLGLLAAVCACSDESKPKPDGQDAQGGQDSDGEGGEMAGGNNGAGGMAGGAAGGMAGGSGGSMSTQPIVIQPSDSRLLYIGRWNRGKPDRPQTDWAGAGIRIHMRGIAVRAQITALSGTPVYQVVVDGMPRSSFKLELGQQWMEVATGLPPGEHVVELYSRLEPRLAGLHQLDALEIHGEVDRAMPSKHRIEFIGDSITCGYGNEFKGVGSPSSPEADNNFLAYGSLTARALAADASTIAWSGIRLTPSSGRVSAPELFEQTLGTSKLPAWDFDRWKPEVVVINLGTNDFNDELPDVTEQQFVDRYDAFVNRIRQVYGEVLIFCTSGPMIGETATRAFVEKRNLTDKKVFLVEFGESEVEGYGGHGHPSVKTHAKMATKLTAAIRAKTGW